MSKQLFKLNRYPIHFVDSCIKQFFQKLYITKNIQDTVNKKTTTHSFTVSRFLVSLLVRKLLQCCTRSRLPYCSLGIVFQFNFQFTTLSTLFCLKDIIHKETNSYCVYKVLCGCWNATYYRK